MIRRFFTAFLAGAVLALASCAEPEEAPPLTDTTAQPTAAELPPPTVPRTDSLQPAPAFSLPRLEGGTFTLAEHKGEVLVVNFWATWCPPCRAEIPDLKQLHTDLHDEGLTVVGISLDEGGAEEVAPFAQEFGINYPVLLDDGTVASAFGDIFGLPTTFVIDQQGQIARRVIGLFPTEEMRPVLRTMLGLPAQPTP